ncbi:hypothetical protein ANCCEY_08613 [Ancylostoma ceylanicum]|uniref:Peptidase A2 domain-containing protein n=1 Tax=Ancylostoma ceylanicum TaxID=53326 RepID=A0A0D6LQL3_9BILA|nr:hypothetical protein ANCCEY_08613 [Ancylostoma ceylanicum]
MSRTNNEAMINHVSDDRGLNVSVNISDLFLPAFHSWPTYDGHNTSVVKFVRDLNEKATAAGYDEEKLARLLPLQLSGAAKIKYMSYSPEIKHDYKKVLDQLKTDFRNRNYVSIVKAKIQHVRQDPDEDVFVFGQRVKDLVEDAYAESGANTVTDISCETFLRGLNTELRIAVMKKKPPSTSYEELLEIAEKEQHLIEMVKRERGVLDSAMINAITEVVRNLQITEPNHSYPETSNFVNGRRGNSSYRGNNRRGHYENRNIAYHNDQHQFRRQNYARNSHFDENQYHTNRGRREFSGPNRQFQNNYRSHSRGRPNNYHRNRSTSRTRNNFRERSQSRYRNTQNSYRERSQSRHRNTRRGGRVASVFHYSPSLFTAISLLCLTSIAYGDKTEFKLCGNGKSGLPIAIPKPLNCLLPEKHSEVMITNANVYVENMKPLILEGIHCFNKSRIICATSFFHLTLKVESDDVITQSISQDTCREMARTKRYNGIPLRSLHESLFDTGNDVTYSYPILGRRCSITSNLIMEIGTVLTNDGENIVSNVGNSEGCKLQDEFCTQQHGVLVWEHPKNNTSYCKFVKSTHSLMYASRDHVLSNELQAVFHFSEEVISVTQKERWCLPKNAVRMINNVYLEFPQMEETSKKTIREVLEGNPLVIRRINERNMRGSKNLRLIKSRTKRSISALFEEPTKNSESMIVSETGEMSPEAKATAVNHFLTMFSNQDDEHTELFHEQRQDQKQYELNVRSQFLSFRLQEQINNDFRFFWTKICNIMNAQIRTVNFLAKADPTSAARILTNGDNVSAIMAGEVLLLSRCKYVKADEILYDNKINEKCYAHTPVRVGPRIFFLMPGSNKELMTKSYHVDCAHIPNSIIYEGRTWKSSGNREVHVSEVALNLPINDYSEMVFNASPIFHSELSRINPLVQILSSNHEILDTTQKLHHSDILNNELVDVQNEGWKAVTTLEENASEILQSEVKFLLDFVPFRYIIIIAICILIFLLIIACCVCYFRCPCKRRLSKTEIVRYQTPKRVVSTSENLQHIEMNDLGSDVQRHSTLKLKTTKFLSYVPIVMGVVGSVEGNHGNHSSPCFVPVRCQNEIVIALLDTGSSITFCNMATVAQLKIKIDSEVIPHAVAANGTYIPFFGSATVSITFGNITKKHRTLVTRNEFSPAAITLGVDFLRRIEKPIRMEFQKNIVCIGRSNLPILDNTNITSFHSTFNIRVSEKTLLPPNSDNFILATIDGFIPKNCDILAEDTNSNKLPEGLFVGRTLFRSGRSGRVPLRILNHSNATITLYPKQNIAKGGVVEQNQHRLVYSVFDTKNNERNNSHVKADIEYIPKEVLLDDDENCDDIGKINWENSELDLVNKSRIVELINQFRDIFLEKNGHPGHYVGDN